MSALPKTGSFLAQPRPAARPARLQAVATAAVPADALPRKGLVVPDAQGTAVHQAVDRNERLREYLTAHKIETTEELTLTLKKQVHRSVRLGDLLVEGKLITAEDLKKALAIQADNRERRLGDILVSMGVVSTRMVQMALSEKLGIPSVNVREFAIDPAALRLVNPGFAVRHQVLPLLRTPDFLVVAVENPLVMEFEQALRFAAGAAILPVIGDPDEIRARIDTEYRALQRAEADRGSRNTAHRGRETQQFNVQELASQLAQDALQESRPSDVSEVETRAADSTLLKLVNKIISDAHTQGASDIHIESNPGRGSTRIRFRKDGEMAEYLELQPAFRSTIVSRIKIMAGLDISERRRSQDGKIQFGRFGGVPIELRVAIIPTANDLEDVVLRLLGGTEPKPLADLAMSKRDLAEIQRIVGRSHGLMLVCGPTGSGKTTTLHSMLRHINRPDLKVWTAEDPVEITQPGLRQVQVNNRIGWTFAEAMRSFLRADPDVIMVGEMRDGETVKVGIEASLTGHLVLSTLHTNSAAESVTRLLNLGTDPYTFADALLGVLSQRLARRLCPKCKRPHIASTTELADLAREFCAGTQADAATILAEWQAEFAHSGKLTLYTAAGCAECSAGYNGRVGVYELLVATDEIKELVRTRGSVPRLAEAGRAGGMRTLKQDALCKVMSGDLDLSSARAVAS